MIFARCKVVQLLSNRSVNWKKSIPVRTSWNSSQARVRNVCRDKAYSRVAMQRHCFDSLPLERFSPKFLLKRFLSGSSSFAAESGQANSASGGIITWFRTKFGGSRYARLLNIFSRHKTFCGLCFVTPILALPILKFCEREWRQCLIYSSPMHLSLKRDSPVATHGALPSSGSGVMGILRRIWRYYLSHFHAFHATLTGFRRALRHVCVFGPLLIAAIPAIVTGQHLGNLWWRFALKGIQDSGPAFVKFAQWAATRRDIFPNDVCERLSTLHSGARAHSLQETHRTITEALGDILDLDHLTVDPKPIGSGSVAQVHRGILAVPGLPPQEVAMKVLHPGVERLVERDLALMASVAGALEWMIPRLRWLALAASVDEFSGLMRAQLDLTIEARNLERLAQNFEGWREVQFPRPLRPYVAQRVLMETMQHGMPLGPILSGTKSMVAPPPANPADGGSGGGGEVGGMGQHAGARGVEASGGEVAAAAGAAAAAGKAAAVAAAADGDEEALIKRRIASIGVRAFLKMCFQDNFIHGDLHPGNILVDVLDPAAAAATMPPPSFWVAPAPTAPWLSSGSAATAAAAAAKPPPVRLTFLDAGIVTELSERDLTNFTALFAAIVRGDGYGAGRLMLDNATEQQCKDPDAFCRGIASLVDKALSSRLRLQSIRAGELLSRAFALACEHRVRIESNFASVCMAIMVLEGVGRNLDPSLDILAAAAPVLATQAAKKALATVAGRASGGVAALRRRVSDRGGRGAAAGNEEEYPAPAANAVVAAAATGR